MAGVTFGIWIELWPSTVLILGFEKVFDAFPGEKLPTVSELQSEYRKLLNEKQRLGEEFAKLKKEIQNYRDAKKNVDQILQVGDEKREKMKDKIER